MFANIAVHLTGSTEDDVRLGHALPLAKQFGARITGLQVHRLPDVVAYTDPTGSSFLQDLLAQSHAEAERLTEDLTAKLEGLRTPYEVRRVDAYAGTVGRELAARARTADLFVGTRPYGDPRGEEFVEEQVLLGAGHGCLFAPPGGEPPTAYNNILVAWNDSKEAARAVAEALPLLRKATEINVALVEEQGASEQFRIEAAAEIGRYLSRHGISAEVRKIGGWVYPGEAILNEASSTDADMIVMGGYGHSRFRELVLGGATRHVLSASPIPVLMAH